MAIFNSYVKLPEGSGCRGLRVGTKGLVNFNHPILGGQ